LGWWIGVVG